MDNSSYYVFVLGYDLLQTYLSDKEITCECAYDVCWRLYQKFIHSEYYALKMSEYDALQKYIEEVWMKEVQREDMVAWMKQYG